VVRNASVLADTMAEEGLRIVAGKTENHMFLTDLRSLDAELTGKAAAVLLDRHGITLNRNSIPFDPRPPFVTSGLRIGTPSVTTAGMRQEQMVTLGRLIVEMLRQRDDDIALKQLSEQVAELAEAFPAYAAGFAGHV
jgi:glycine hydroxymethyltransferase